MSFLHTLAASLPMHPETRTDFAGLLPLPRSICNRRFLYVYLLATVHKNFWTDLHEIFREGCQWANEQMINFWWQSGLWIQIRTTTLVRRALAEVCTLPVLLVYFRREKRANWYKDKAITDITLRPQCCPLVSQFEYVLLQCAISPIMVKDDVIHKIGSTLVVLHGQIHGNTYRKFGKVWTVVFDICEHTDRQTYTHAHHNTLQP